MSKQSEAVENEIVIASNNSMLPGFKIARRVTLPLSKWKNEVSKYLRIEGEIFQGKEIESPKEGEQEKPPAFLFNATDLETGEMVQVIAAKVLKSTLSEEYPDLGYVGKMFQITQHRDTAKKYNTFSITEVEAS
jgi:hypothetical protein